MSLVSQIFSGRIHATLLIALLAACAANLVLVCAFL